MRGDHRLQQFQRLRLNAGRALRQTCEFQRHHQPRHGFGHRLAHSGGMRQNDVSLQGGEVGFLYAHAGEFSEACIDAVDRLTLGNDPGDCLGTLLHTRLACRIEPGHRSVIHCPPLGERDVSRLQDKFRHSPLQIRACSGLNPMR